jgi:hypothetical protein
MIPPAQVVAEEPAKETETAAPAAETKTEKVEDAAAAVAAKKEKVSRRLSTRITNIFSKPSREAKKEEPAAVAEEAPKIEEPAPVAPLAVEEPKAEEVSHPNLWRLRSLLIYPRPSPLLLPQQLKLSISWLENPNASSTLFLNSVLGGYHNSTSLMISFSSLLKQSANSRIL